MIVKKTNSAEETKEFGISVCSADQDMISSVAGDVSGRDVDKIAVLRDLGAEFRKAKQINVLMVKGAAMTAECKLYKTLNIGDHVLFVGSVVEITGSKKDPLVFSRNYCDPLSQVRAKAHQTLWKRCHHNLSAIA